MPADRDALFRIQQPCPLASPDLLKGGHCDRCDRTVHDLSALTRREATRLRRAHQRRGERLCGIVRQDREGRVQFQPGLLDRLTRHLRAMPALAILFQPGSCSPPPPPTPPTPPAPQVDPEAIEALKNIGYIALEPEPEPSAQELEELLTIGGYLE